MNKTVFCLTGATAVLLFAADPWKNADFTQWSTEDAQKVLNKSPWVKETTVSMGAMPQSGGGGSKRGGGGGGMGGMGGGGGMGGMGGGGGMDSGMGGRGSGRGGDDMQTSESRQAPPAQKILVRWESAMPVLEARMKMKFGDKLPAKGEPGYVLDQPQTNYLISVAGMRMGGGRGRGGERGGESADPDAQKARADRMKDQLMSSTHLNRKGKDPINPIDVQVSQQTGTMLFIFPKTDAISEDDKEVEFVTTMGPVQIKQKFNLKDMHFNGKLEL